MMRCDCCAPKTSAKSCLGPGFGANLRLASLLPALVVFVSLYGAFGFHKLAFSASATRLPQTFLSVRQTDYAVHHVSISAQMSAFDVVSIIGSSDNRRAALVGGGLVVVSGEASIAKWF
eukprot:CAMPEP_0194548036 /NCGR_PEP_ID=MMETSP0253-20130528/93029_1 /TAXON_ID=2966 /ORGANISM="Noctiluca scintillans" /LENGTH=118 /DNA_ID=CAMNT_0039395307 /DNA_START=76 /DNA_END=432 /DNA_ORIENTATION=+